MLKPLLRIALSLFFPILLLNTVVQAQSAFETYFFLHDQTLWKWTETAELAQVGERLPDMLSYSLAPDNNWFVYRVLTPRAIETIAIECPCGGGDFPSNIWGLNATTGETVLIAGQSPDAKSTVEEITRSNMVWSPDGTRLAWIEGVEGGNLAIYDFTNGTTSRFTEDFPIQALASTTPDLTAWTDSGLLYVGDEYDDNLNPVATDFVFFNPENGAVNLNISTDYLPERNFRIVTNNGADAVLIDNDTRWLLLDPRTGSIEDLPNGLVSRYAAGKLATSLRIEPPLMSDDGSLSWNVRSPDGILMTTLKTRAGDTPILSGSGYAIMSVMNGNSISVIRSPEDTGGFTIDLPWLPDRILAGRTADLLERGGTQVIVNARCEGSSLPFRLSSQENAYVLGDTPNNIRSEPTSSASLLGQIPAGDWFTVLDEPRCSQGTAWWQIAYSGVTGWTAEGQDDAYWLAPGCGQLNCARG